MARYCITIEYEAINESEALASRGELLRGVDERPGIWMGLRLSVSSPTLLPDPVDSHGEHGVAYGGVTKFSDIPKFPPDAIDDLCRPLAPSESKEHAATCTCYMGNGAQPYAHEPSCAMHPRFVDAAVSDANGKAEDVPAPLLDGAEQDGSRKDLEAEYARTLALVKAGYNFDDPISRLYIIGECLGFSVSNVYRDMLMV